MKSEQRIRQNEATSKLSAAQTDLTTLFNKNHGKWSQKTELETSGFQASDVYYPGIIRKNQVSQISC